MQSGLYVVSPQDATRFLDKVEQIMLVENAELGAEKFGIRIWRGESAQYQGRVSGRRGTPIGSFDTVVAGLGKQGEEPTVHLMKVWVDRPAGQLRLHFDGMDDEIDEHIPLMRAKSPLQSVREYHRKLPKLFSPTV
jgi:hypothetical protein